MDGCRCTPQKPAWGVADAYDHIVGLLPRLLKIPRVVVTQTIPPSTAHRAHENFLHLRELDSGAQFPARVLYSWKDRQIEALAGGFDAISKTIQEDWNTGAKMYIRNLFTWAPTPFFNSGLVVDSTGASNEYGVEWSLDQPSTRQKWATWTIHLQRTNWRKVPNESMRFFIRNYPRSWNPREESMRSSPGFAGDCMHPLQRTNRGDRKHGETEVTTNLDRTQWRRWSAWNSISLPVRSDVFCSEDHRMKRYKGFRYVGTRGYSSPDACEKWGA